MIIGLILWSILGAVFFFSLQNIGAFENASALKTFIVALFCGPISTFFALVVTLFAGAILFLCPKDKALEIAQKLQNRK